MASAKLLLLLGGMALIAVSFVAAKEHEPVDEQKLDYAKKSICNYCSNCKFCPLCDEQCPCETSAGRPACEMCKYCKYCYVCSAVCDTICQPGGMLDKVSGAIVNNLPDFNLKEVDQELNKYKDELEKHVDL